MTYQQAQERVRGLVLCYMALCAGILLAISVAAVAGLPEKILTMMILGDFAVLLGGFALILYEIKRRNALAEGEKP